MTRPDRANRPLALRLFGPFEVRLHGAPLPRLRSRKGEWLLALLALRHGGDVERAWLAATLWPDSPEPQGLANLRISLTDLRRALGPEANRLRSPSTRSLSLDLSGAEVDVVLFDQAVAEGDASSWERAVALYRGPLLEACAEEWVVQERSQREQAYLAALERLAAAAAESDPRAVEGYLRRAVAVDASRETAQRALIQTLATSGNYAAAAQVYRELRLYLHRELSLEPDPETRALFERIRAEARGKAALGARCSVLGRGKSKTRLCPSRAPSTEHRARERSDMTSLIVLSDESETRAGNYFVSNYPPYSFWKPEHVGEAAAALERLPARGDPPAPDTPLGVYLHIPFCRKRCHFCYFRVYTDKNSQEIQRYLDAAIEELTLYVERPFLGGRKPSFIYFGGGTPSYLSVRQLTSLTDRMKRLLPWEEAEEVTFECEPGTLTEPKLSYLREMGVTRLSLGVEHFEERILRLNGRAHGAKEIDRAYEFARSVGFPQINIDLIAGMMGDTDDLWQTAIEKTIALQPDSVTVYQMEIPYNTTIYQEMKAQGHEIAPVAGWGTKRRWVDSAFRQLESVGYTITSAYTAVKDPERTKFVYRDRLWTGADLIGLGVASFSHVGGTHYQNEHHWEPYIRRLNAGELPIYRALTPTAEERMIRELILQFKLGHVDAGYFRRKFHVEIQERFATSLQTLRDWGYLIDHGDDLQLNRDGLLQADRLVHEFFLPQHRDARYA
jgi:oxygen-independent coproporphyrinogen-3 oxidase